ncbi:SDR family oxidoreductase [Spongiibacter sp. KMU-166]|uniref:SDR family oxidoreductase n=1 Tax=Spongiibacter thalassae TaxID=2721624 RepID=A0ABX1G9W2_9GAMM|nr:SDR family oxidoreductase [Spongiibacter thalassae]NKI15950.1 SDR family oxidoreductase [Spongiibacter thalassae]
MTVSINLDGKTALVAGGSSGIGLGIAQKLKQAGAVVHITGTRASSSDYNESDLNGLIFHSLDVADTNAVKAFADSFESLDILVSSVGIVAYGGAEYEIETFRKVIDVNLNGVMHLCTCFRGLLEGNEQREGTIVLVGSTSSFIATPGQPAYSASKGALLTLTKSLAQAWARKGIRVNGIAPGFVKTKLTQRSWEDKEVYKASSARIPLKRWGEAEEMGNAALFLASPMSSYVTGQMLLVDGGITLM